MKISLRRRHARTVKDCASSHKINNMNIFSKIIICEGHLNGFNGSKGTAILVNGGILLPVELHREGSAPAACAAGLFIYITTISYI